MKLALLMLFSLIFTSPEVYPIFKGKITYITSKDKLFETFDVRSETTFGTNYNITQQLTHPRKTDIDYISTTYVLYDSCYNYYYYPNKNILEKRPIHNLETHPIWHILPKDTMLLGFTCILMQTDSILATQLDSEFTASAPAYYIPYRIAMQRYVMKDFKNTYPSCRDTIINPKKLDAFDYVMLYNAQYILNKNGDTLSRSYTQAISIDTQHYAQKAIFPKDFILLER